ncbi:hypothetical protein EAH_00051970 [Eimeria acervulina]|uniref:Splicing factor SF3a60 binding domain-containing protein n=1 Tax=Eimeria acervulina TaxID=5801 RepID=U6GMI8_EIMAC|nr:hypothetical protein EAH_00051970 [Eimeria acervulina]CDI80493.1 hypothetical protein EAH_00051970 [Eimeria acervulina]
MEETLFLGGKRHPKRSSSSSSSSSSNDVWTNFYERLKDIRSLHKRRQLTQPQEENVPYTPPSTQEILQEYLDTPYLDAVFTTSEDFGRRLSLDDFFSSFCNLKKIQRHFAKESTEKELSRLRKKGLSEEALKERAASLLAENEETMFDYLSFIRLLGDFSGVPRHLKYKQKDYRDFLLRLAEYLKDFFFRANPFADADKVEETISAEFNRLFKDKQIRGWETETHKLELYCLLSDRLFASPNTKAHYQQSAAYKKKLLEAASSSNEKREEIIKSSEETDRDIASLEFSIKYFVDMLQPQINQTIAYYQKKQSTNAEEALEEDNEESSDEEDAAAAEEESEAEEDEGPVYNPLNLPLGKVFRV